MGRVIDGGEKMKCDRSAPVGQRSPASTESSFSAVKNGLAPSADCWSNRSAMEIGGIPWKHMDERLLRVSPKVTPADEDVVWSQSDQMRHSPCMLLEKKSHGVLCFLKLSPHLCPSIA